MNLANYSPDLTGFDGVGHLTGQVSLAAILSELNGSDTTTSGSGSQESQLSQRSQISIGGLDRRMIEEAASFAAMEIEWNQQCPPGGIATRKSTSSSESQADSQNSQSASSQDVRMIDSPPRSLIRLWSPPADAIHKADSSLPPVADGKLADEGILLLSHPEEGVAMSSSQATSSLSGMQPARHDSGDESDDESGPISRPDYTKRNEKKKFPTRNVVLDTRRGQRKGRSKHQCPVCKSFFAGETSLSRHRSAFKMHPRCLDLDAAPLTVYRCGIDDCDYRDHRRDNVFNHVAAHHPGEHSRNNITEIIYERADLEALLKASEPRN